MIQGGGRAENLDRTGLQSRLCQTSHSRRSANFVEYAKVVGLNPVADSSRPHKWHYRAEAQLDFSQFLTGFTETARP
jgi:hypothetical protein